MTLYNLECTKVNCGASHNKNWAKSTKYSSCTFSRQYILTPLRSYQLEAQDQIKINKVVLLLKKVIQRGLRLIWRAEKVKCEADRSNNWAKLIKYASCTSSRQYLLSLRRSFRPEVQDNRNFILGIFPTSSTMTRALQWRYYS